MPAGDKKQLEHGFVGAGLHGSFADAVRTAVRRLGTGEVVSYGEIARRAGRPGAARAVGNVLASSVGLPWWRVLRASGELVAASRAEQARRLGREGVPVVNGRVKCQLNLRKPPSRRLVNTT
jgi:methylated-DNA-protein-cysteine methyltransferase-like protein